MSIRSATGFLLLAFVVTIALTACQTTETQRIIDVGPSDTRSTVTGTIVDSITGEPLDSVTVSYRGAGQTLYTNAQGEFTLPDAPPGVYVFDLSKYGYHERRNVAAVVSPDDETVEITATMLSQSLDMQCRDVNADYHGDIESFLREDSSGVRLRSLDFVADGSEVLLQPVISNNVNAPIFMPENVGKYGHYELTLVNENGEPIPFEYPGAEPQGDGMGDKQVYERGDVRVIVPRQSQRLDATTVRLAESVAPGTPIYGRMRYTFSLDETLRPTPTSTFPSVTLDSLRAPFFDTLRVSDRLIVPDSLVLGVDTTLVRVVGTDTTITRDNQVLYSSAENDTMDVRTALALLRLRKPDQPLGPLELPAVDTTRPPLYTTTRFDYYGLDTLITEQKRLDDLLAASWPKDSLNTEALRTRRRPLWRHEPPSPENPSRLDSLLAQTFVPDSIRIDSLLSDSTLLASLLPEPSAPGADRVALAPDSAAVDTAAADTATMSDAITPDTTETGAAPDPRMADTTATDSVAADTTKMDATEMDTTEMDTTATDAMTTDAMTADTVATDTVATDTTMADTTMADTTMADTTMADSVGVAAASDTTDMAPAQPEEPVVTIDSLRKTVDVDSLRAARRAAILEEALARDTTRNVPLDMLRSAVLVDSLERSIRGDSLRAGLPPTPDLVSLAATLDSLKNLPPIPQNKLVLTVPDDWTADSTRVLLLSPTFLRQPMNTLLDTSMVDDITTLTPQRLVLRQRRLSQIIVQQIILAPISVYREEFLETWAEVQRENLRDPYCDILRAPLETEWRSTTVQ